MTEMRVTVRTEIVDESGAPISVVEHAVEARAFGDNARFFGDVADQAAQIAAARVRRSIEAVHGEAPAQAHASFA